MTDSAGRGVRLQGFLKDNGGRKSSVAPSGARKTTQRLHCDSSESSTFSPRARAVRATQSLARGHHFLSSTGSLFVCRAGIAHAVGRLERPSEKPGAVLTRVRVRGTAKNKPKKNIIFFLSPQNQLPMRIL